MCGIFGVLNTEHSFEIIDKSFLKGRHRGPETSKLNNIFIVVGTEVPFAGGGQDSKIIPTKTSSIIEEFKQYKILFHQYFFFFLL